MRIRGKLLAKISEEFREIVEEDVFLRSEGRTYRNCVLFHRRVVEDRTKRKDKALIDVESPDERVRKQALSYLEGLCPGGK